MYIKTIKAKNYKSFYEGNSIDFGAGNNIVIGKNNAGKSSLLELLTLNFSSKPHISKLTKPRIDTSVYPKSEITIEMLLKRQELYDFIINNGNKCRFHSLKNNTPPEIARYEEKLNRNEDFIFSFTFRENSPYDIKILDDEFFFNSNNFSSTILVEDNKLKIKGGSVSSDIALPNHFFTELKKNIYYFHSERYKLGKCKHGTNIKLKSDSSNLAEVLNNLNSNPEKLNRYNELVNLVFPEISRVTTVNRQSNEIEIMIWTEDTKSERDDLSISLNQSGSGIGQVLSIIYVILFSTEPSTIIIDEPQAFLHPGAIRKLFHIINKHQFHQYIFATHSPVVINSSKNSSIIFLEKENNQTVGNTISKHDYLEMQEIFQSLDIRLSDVFGADNLIWVEGPTEENVFPLLSKIENSPGIQICSVKNTGDLENRKSRIIFDIYKRLSGGNRLFPPAICFIFDREYRTEQEMIDLKKLSEGKLFFLNRTMFENYIIDSSAISNILNQRIEEFEIPSEKTTEDDIEAWIKEHFSDSTYYKFDTSIGTDDLEYKDELWKQKIHASSFLDELFHHFLLGTYTYQKTKDSVDISKDIIKNKDDFLKPLKEELLSIIDITKETV